jgi:hypothetical protein
MPEQYFITGENPSLNWLYWSEVQLNVYRNKNNNCLTIKGLVINYPQAAHLRNVL